MLKQKKHELVELAKEHGVAVTGTKEQLVSAIMDQDGGKLRMLGKDGHKLREYTETLPAHIEFLCIGCKKQTRVVRTATHLALKPLPNGAFLLHGSNDCKVCKKSRAVNKIVSKANATKLMTVGVKLIK